MSNPIPENKVKPEYLNIHLYIVEFILYIYSQTRHIISSQVSLVPKNVASGKDNVTLEVELTARSFDLRGY